MILSDTACFYQHKQTPRHISKSLRLRNLTTRNPIQFDLGQCGLTVPGCRELDNILLLHPNYRKGVGMFGLHAENAETIWNHYNPLHFKSFQGNHQIQGSIHRAVICYALILCRTNNEMSKNLAREEYHGTFRVIFDDFLEPGKSGKIWEMARAKSLQNDSRQFLSIRWFFWLELTLNSTEERLSSCSSTPQHSISASVNMSWQALTASMMLRYIVFQTFDSLSMFNSSCCFLGMWVGIPEQSKSAKSGSVSNSSHHWTQQADHIGPLCKHRQSHRFPLSAAHPEVSQ